MLQIESCLAKVAIERIAGGLVFPRSHETRKAVEGFQSNDKALPISRAAERPREAINVFAVIAEPDVRSARRRTGLRVPAIAGRSRSMSGDSARTLGQKSFEKKIDSNRIDSGDAERVANGAIGRATVSVTEERIRCKGG